MLGTHGQSPPRPPTTPQEPALPEADISGLIGPLEEGFPLKVNWSQAEIYAQKEGETPESLC